MAGSTAESSMSRPTSGIISPRQIRSRTQSISSDRPSTVGHYNLMTPPQTVSPQAAFIAPSAASQIITNDHDSHADTWYDQNGIEPPAQPAEVTETALQLVNSFLDQLLFNFLQVSKATTLAALRPAVSDVLKPKLAKDTIHNADEELREYLGGADEDAYVQPQGPSTSRDWDVELVWKRTRLRCMVYSSLGDLEEEDEDIFMEQENLEIGANEQISDVISPAVAIFLTSVLEYMGELTLTVAGQAAYTRTRIKMEKDLKDGTRSPSEVADQIIVEELDMERVALDRTLGRLWRGWKKRIRAPTTPIDLVGRTFPRGSGSHARQEHGAADALSPKFGVSSDVGDEFHKSQEYAADTIAEDVQPTDIPLPMGDRDIDEIEVPGLVQHSDDEEEEEGEAYMESESLRPKSLLLGSSHLPNGFPTPENSQTAIPPPLHRQRSYSLPTPSASIFFAISKPLETTQPNSEDEAIELEGSARTDEQKVPHQDEAEEVSDAAAEAEPCPEKGATGRQLKIATAAIGGASAAAVEAALIAQDSDSESGGDDGDEDAVYEKAEIVTSSRVSVEGSSSSSISDSGRAVSLKRSSSVHSARIIDVPGPKSPTSSRPTSMEAVERGTVRPASLSGLSNGAFATSPEDSRRAKFADAVSGTAPAGMLSRSPADRVRSLTPSATTISESEEEELLSGQTAKVHSQVKAARGPTSAPSADILDNAISRTPKMPAVVAPSQDDVLSPGRQRSHPGKRVSAIKTTNFSYQTTEQTSPEIPRKSPPAHSTRHFSKNEGGGMSSMERTRTNETDDDASLSLPQNVGSRQAPASASSVSSGTSRLKPVRTSEDNSSSRAESVARNFEELIQSNQTITYTLTPENMRDIDSKRALDSPVVTKPSRKSEDARSYNPSRASPTVSDVAPSPTAHRFPSQVNHIINENGVVKPAGPVPRAPPGLAVTTSRASGPQAREARVPTDTTADFAEFIKSTGPPGASQSPVSRNANVPLSPTKKSFDSRRVSTASTRSRYQPRDAIVESKSDNADLLNFIRQGPPIAASNHRIPRHVAPFRTTMDSDQMNGVVGGKAVDASIPEIRYSQASTNQTDNSMPSMQSSVNSNTALVSKNKGANVPNKFFDEDDMMPKRKTRRVRDPYAIDISDEEEEDDDGSPTAALKPPVKREESLAEFLRNYDPPPVPVSQPRKMPKKKSSAPSLINRFRSSTKDSRDGRDGSRELNVHTPPRSFTANESRSLSSRAGTVGSSGKGYIPLQVNMPPGYNKYGPIDSNPGRPRVVSSASTANRIPMKKFEPRDPVSRQSETSDLAAFLRDSEPPPSPPSRAVQHFERNDEPRGLSKVFGRRKK